MCVYQPENHAIIKVSVSMTRACHIAAVSEKSP
jgi:hypothetical protein